MITNTAERQVQTRSGETQEFTIKANGKAFRALISTLYENKIQSIVREIWSNALDAHIAADCAERPFSVTFPTILNPTFVVRDYGVSLSHDQVMKLYTTVFESTKEDTNDATGKFGLGSKSPFAYTDTFSVVAVKDGMKRFYSAVIGKHGIPAIHFLGEEPSTDEPGLEVSFPIKTNDIRAFRNAARRVSHGFDVKPDVIRTVGEDEFEGWPELSVLSQGADWKLLSGVIEGYRAQAYAKMGPVLYPINMEAMEDLTENERSLLQSTLVIEFAMGELEMTPSREALSYGSDEPTVASITAKLRKILNEMLATFQAEYDVCGSYWEACTLFREHISSNAPGAVRAELRKKAKWNGLQLDTLRRFKAEELPGVSICQITGSSVRNAMYRFRSDRDPAIEFKKNTVVYIEEDGVDQRAASKIHYDISRRDVKDRPQTIIWIRARTPSRRAFSTDVNEKLEAFYKTIEGADITMVADLAEPPRAAGGGSGVRAKVQVRKLNNYDFDTRVDVDYETGGYYVPLERMEPVHPYTKAPPRAMFDALKAAGVVPADSVLYGAPKSLWKKFEDPAWVNIYDLAEEAFKKSQPKASLAKRAFITAVRSNTELRWTKEALRLEDLNEGPARDAIEFYNKVMGYTVPDVDGFVALAKATGNGAVIEKWSEFDSTEIFHHVQALEEYYPLLSVVRSNVTYKDKYVDKLTEYVQMCDKLESFNSESAADAA